MLCELDSDTYFEDLELNLPVRTCRIGSRTGVLGAEVVIQRPLAGEFSGSTQPKVNFKCLDCSMELTNVRLIGSGLLNVGQFGLEVILLSTNLFVPPLPQKYSAIIFFSCQASHMELLRCDIFLCWILK